METTKRVREMLQTSHFEAWMLVQRDPRTSPVQRFLGLHKGIKTDDVDGRGKGASRLIHPLSPFTFSMNTLSGILLCYCFLVTPVQLAFHWNDDTCYRPDTLELDMAVEVYFIFEILIMFFTGTYDSHGNYYDDFPSVFLKYFWTGNLVFDTLTGIPLSWIEWSVIKELCVQGSAQGSLSDHITQNYLIAKTPLRLLRPLRLFKMARIARFVKVLKIMETRAPLDIWVQKAIFLVFSMAFLVHICCCAFWLIKEVYEEDMDAFVASHGVGSQDIAGQYILSAYFVNTVFTTVGFGDIAGSNTAERMFCIVLLWLGTICFAVIVSEMQDLVSKYNHHNQERKERIQKTSRLLKSYGCDKNLLRDVLHWTHFSFMVNREQDDYHDVVSKLPVDLKERLALHVNHGILMSMPVFQGIKDPHLESFAANLFLESQFMLLRPKEVIATELDIVDCVYMIRSGAVRVKVGDHHMREQFDFQRISSDKLGRHPEIQDIGDAKKKPKTFLSSRPSVSSSYQSPDMHSLRDGLLLTAGDYFGEFAFIEDQRFAELDYVSFISEGTSELHFVTRESFIKVLKQYPESFRRAFEFAVLSQRATNRGQHISLDSIAKNVQGTMFSALDGMLKLHMRSPSAKLLYERWAMLSKCALLYLVGGLPRQLKRESVVYEANLENRNLRSLHSPSNMHDGRTAFFTASPHGSSHAESGDYFPGITSPKRRQAETRPILETAIQHTLKPIPIFNGTASGSQDSNPRSSSQANTPATNLNDVQLSAFPAPVGELHASLDARMLTLEQNMGKNTRAVEGLDKKVDALAAQLSQLTAVLSPLTEKAYLANFNI